MQVETAAPSKESLNAILALLNAGEISAVYSSIKKRTKLGLINSGRRSTPSLFKRDDNFGVRAVCQFDF